MRAAFGPPPLFSLLFVHICAVFRCVRGSEGLIGPDGHIGWGIYRWLSVWVCACTYVYVCVCMRMCMYVAVVWLSNPDYAIHI